MSSFAEKGFRPSIGSIASHGRCGSVHFKSSQVLLEDPKQNLRREIMKGMNWSKTVLKHVARDSKAGKLPKNFAGAVPSIWSTLLKESRIQRKEVLNYKRLMTHKCDEIQSPLMDYMCTQLLHCLNPILESLFFKAIETNSLKHQKSLFNGIDYIAESLWNSNPAYPERQEDNLFIHDMDWVKKYLEEHPRPYFPLSWIFTPEIAATKIQAYVRAYWVRRREDVQEMRQFWKALKSETIIRTSYLFTSDNLEELL